jgi:hypothetical protein
VGRECSLDLGLIHPVSQVKWIFSSVVELKQTLVPEYKNMIGQAP